MQQAQAKLVGQVKVEVDNQETLYHPHGVSPPFSAEKGGTPNSVRCAFPADSSCKMDNGIRHKKQASIH